MSTALNTGTRMSYTDTTAQIRSVEDLINNISPDTVPFLKAMGGPAKIKMPNINVKFEWLEDCLPTRTGTLASTIADTTTTTVSVAANEGTFFRAGQIVKMETEYLRIASVAADVLTYTRAFGGTQAATHVNGTAYEILGVAMLEGADAVVDATTTITAPYNKIQEITHGWKIATVQQMLSQYGIKDEYSYQGAKALKQCAIDLEKFGIKGKRSDGSATVASAFGGLGQFITNNVTSASSASLSLALLNTLLQDIWDDAEDQMGKLCMVNGWQRRKITELFSPSARMDASDTTGGVTIDNVRTDFGVTLGILMCQHCETDRLYILNPDFIGYVSVKPFESNELTGHIGHYRLGEVYGIYSFKCANDKAHGYLHTLATS